MDLYHLIRKGAYDLHMHTTASDGVYTPSAVVRRMRDLGKRTIAITDHDTMSGVREAQEEGEKLGIVVIPGIELTTYYQGERIDILGYGLTETDELRDILQQVRDQREERAQLIMKKFHEQGMPLTIEDVSEFSQGAVIARPHIAKAVVAKGYVKDVKTVFDLYLGDGKVCNVEKLMLTPKQGVELIHKSGGLAVLAHPAVIKNQHLIEELIAYGFDGIEVHHPLHTVSQETAYRKLATTYKLIPTGGSDFHE
ncbi:PHP domain-containing protein [Metabacillus iocasae]|uniref:Metal-dependent phosphoesterase TrpH n=1 Tax=Priestia iocasae TaxID=2291674 RepID=A0ABS2QSU9_9BACI|nr:PHP domain-containing protein [Metabacillus iocasae]MBM7702538.1 putative metal-dependent phosphoesterase TrpH [Metabacillus iocasae]